MAEGVGISSGSSDHQGLLPLPGVVPEMPGYTP